jgi:hypothetical protein
MSASRFLVARVPLDAAMAGEVRWLTGIGAPFGEVDVIDFPAADLGRIFALYKDTYGRFAPKSGSAPNFNVPLADGLFEYNRFVLMVNASGEIVAFVLAKDTDHGVKLCATGGDGSREARAAIVALHIDALNTDGVYAEVSNPMEDKLGKAVPTVPARKASRILAGKNIVAHADGVHYTREITNLGPQTKKLVGRPLARAARSKRG